MRLPACLPAPLAACQSASLQQFSGLDGCVCKHAGSQQLQHGRRCPHRLAAQGRAGQLACLAPLHVSCSRTGLKQGCHVQYFALIFKGRHARATVWSTPTRSCRHHDVGALKRAQSEAPLTQDDISVSDASVPRRGTHLASDSVLGPKQVV